MRGEADGNFFDALRGSWNILPLHHGLYCAFRENGIAAHHVHAAHFSLGTDGRLQSNQAADLRMP